MMAAPSGTHIQEKLFHREHEEPAGQTLPLDHGPSVQSSGLQLPSPPHWSQVAYTGLGAANRWIRLTYFLQPGVFSRRTIRAWPCALQFGTN